MPCSLPRFVLRECHPQGKHEQSPGVVSSTTQLTACGTVWVRDHFLQTKPTQQSHRKREFVNVTGEPHTSQEMKIELQTTWSLEAQATAQSQGASSLRIPWGPGPCDCAAERVLLSAPCGAAWSVASGSTFLLPSLSVVPSFHGGCQNGDLSPEPRAFQWVFPSVHALLCQI